MNTNMAHQPKINFDWKYLISVSSLVQHDTSRVHNYGTPDAATAEGAGQDDYREIA